MTIEESRDLYLSGRSRVLRPLSLVQEAWADKSFRDNVVFDLAKCVSKEGSFSQVHWLNTLSGALSLEQARDLYIEIRDRSRRVELLWRTEFVSAFPEVESLLPSIVVDDKLRIAFTRKLALAMDTQDDQHVAQVIEDIEGMRIPCNSLWKITSETVTEDPPYFEYTHPTDLSGVTLLELARRESTPQIVRLLEEYAQRL